MLVKSALNEAQMSTGVRIKNEQQLADEIARSLDEQGDDEEETDLFADTEDTEETGDEEEVEVDTEETDDEEEVEVDTEEIEVEEKPKSKRKMSPPKLATGLTYKDFKHNFNTIRSAKAVSKTINGDVMITKTGKRLRDYFEALNDTEKKSLQRFMVGLAQILVVGTSADNAVQPDLQAVSSAEVDVEISEPSDADVEIGTAPPVRIVGSKIEAFVRLKSRLIG